MLDGVKAWLRPKIPAEWIVKFHIWQAKASACYFGYPAKKLKVIGITGTNGKTTSSILTAAILRETGARVAEATTVHFKIDRRVWKNNTKMTTVSAWELEHFLARAQRAGCQYAVLEITSHALAQFRTFGIQFWAVALTNITHDHLDYHQTFQRYVQTKLKLFQHHPRLAVVNFDDPNGKLFFQQKADRKLAYALKDSTAQLRARKIISHSNGETFTLITPAGQKTIHLSLRGRFNIYNALTAASLGIGLGVSLEGIKRGLEKVRGVRGRLEKINLGQPFEVVLDYAHTPDALEQVYRLIRPSVQGRIIAVFGATGERDRTKRPILGKIASRQADVIILTNEDPYTEDPLSIIHQVAAGIQEKKWIQGKNYFQILSRRQAIAKALRLARRGDLVLITGKGHEEMMAVRHPSNARRSVLIPFNERQIIQDELKKLKTKFAGD